MFQLKQERAILRYPDRGMRNAPKEPLTTEDKKMLLDKSWPTCRNAYVQRMTKSALLSDFEEPRDLPGEAFIFFCNIMKKFDKSVYKGKIADKDYPGAKAPKTLNFFFEVYFSGRVNFTACEAREHKKKWKIGRSSGTGTALEVSVDAESGQEFSEYNYEYEATGEIINALKGKSEEFNRFYYESLYLGIKQVELRGRYGSIRYKQLKKDFDKFRNEMKRRFGDTYEKDKGSHLTDEAINLTDDEKKFLMTKCWEDFKEAYLAKMGSITPLTKSDIERYSDYAVDFFSNAVNKLDKRDFEELQKPYTQKTLISTFNNVLEEKIKFMKVK